MTRNTAVAGCAAACLLLLLGGTATAQEAEPTAPAEEAAPATTRSLDELQADLSAPDAAVRVQAVQALGERADPVTVPRLVEVLRNDPVPEVRGWAVRTLYQIGTPEARSAVVGAARQDPDERVRGMASRLTGVTAPPPSGAATAPAPVAPPPAVVAQVVEAPPPPPPRRRQRPPGRGLRIGGWVTTGVTYGIALLAGFGLMSTGDPGSIDWGWKMILPVVGPVVASMTNWEGDEAAMSIWFWLWSAGQATGVILLTVGYMQRARHLEETEGEDEEDRYASRGSTFGFSFAPGGPGGTPGLGVVGWW